VIAPASSARNVCVLALTLTAAVFARCGISVAEAQEIAVPRVTIYPGDRIDDAMLEEISSAQALVPERGIVASRRELVGKSARRTLLPGEPILAVAIDNPRIVVIGAQVKIIFSEGGLVITAFGMALQAGGVGDLIRVRNQDSGLTVTGLVQTDGSIRVSEG